MAYINGEPRSANVKATKDCELVEIPIHLLDHVLFMKPAWAKALMKTLSRRIKNANSSAGTDE
jgi:CRP-like cAMP-binding protein